MTIIKEVLSLWNKIGILDVILPFVLIYTLVYGTLDKTKILGKESQNYNPIIAFVLGFLGVATLQITNALTAIVQYTALGMIAVVFIVIVGKFMGGFDEEEKKSNFHKYLALIIMGIIAFYALGFYNWIDFFK
ncbi:hypothetical protein ACFLZN_02440 [Nanoarchaeota archaeon]